MNSRPVIRYQSPQSSNYRVYNNETIYRLENYGTLRMLYLIFSITPAADSDFSLPTSPYLIKSVTLESFGNVIARLDTNYILARLDELSGDIYNQISDGASVKQPFDTTRTITLPLFFWPLDNQSIDTIKYPNLTVRCVTQSSAAKMGFDQEITSIDTQLKMIYTSPLVSTPLDLSKAYNTYSRQTYPIAVNASTYSVKLNVPYKVTNLYFSVTQENLGGYFLPIESITLNSPNGVIGKFEKSTSYIIGKTSGTNINEGTVFSINLGPRMGDGYSMEFNLTNNPIIADLVFTANNNILTPTELNVVFEYKSEIEEGPDGLLIEKVSGTFK